jgi:hypothetical protein
MGHPFYESDLTRLLRDLLAGNPSIGESQHRGRGMLWDKAVNFDALHREAVSEVPMRGYPYDWYSPQPQPKRPQPDAGPTTE